MINLNICVSDIPKDKIYKGQNGKSYMNITVAERKEPDQYKNTHTVFMNKSQAEQNDPTIYIGSGKEVIFNNQTSKSNNQKGEKKKDVDELPF